MRFIRLSLIASTALLPRSESAMKAAGPLTTDQKDTTAVMHVTTDQNGLPPARLLRSQVLIHEIEEPTIASVASLVKPSSEQSTTAIETALAFNLEKMRLVPENAVAGIYPKWSQDYFPYKIPVYVSGAEMMIEEADRAIRADRAVLRTRGMLGSLNPDDENAEVKRKVEEAVGVRLSNFARKEPVTDFQAQLTVFLTEMRTSVKQKNLAKRFEKGMVELYQKKLHLYHFLRSEQMLELASEAAGEEDFLFLFLCVENEYTLAYSLTLLKMLGNSAQQEFATKYFELIPPWIARTLDVSKHIHLLQALFTRSKFPSV
uniref:RxLR effector candidate protein n=1 Tax=Peronospora matthiolae TaxID=2874970 RepID=A0AAV1T7K5_9STRA